MLYIGKFSKVVIKIVIYIIVITWLGALKIESAYCAEYDTSTQISSLQNPAFVSKQAQVRANKITLDIKEMEITDVLKMLAIKGGMNIVAGRNVRGRVTVFLKDVDIMDALDIICVSNGLAYEKKGNIIHVMTERDFEMRYGVKYQDKSQIKVIQLRYVKASDVSKSLTQIKSRIGKIVVDDASNTIVILDTPTVAMRMIELARHMDVPTKTKVFALNYAKVEDIKKKLEPFITKGIGKINIDERTNKIIVTDLVNNMPLIEHAVREFDEKTKEVLIEAKILQITLNDEYKAGINWDAVFSGLDAQIGLNFDVDTTLTLPSWTSGGAGGVFHIKNLTADGFEAMVKFLQQFGKTNLLSSPRIVTLNNEEAKILVGINQPYATSQTTVGSAGAPVRSYQITFLELGVKLYVTPTVNREGFITMKIKPEVSSITDTLTYGDQNDKVPIVKTSQAETTVMVKDGTTIVIAGLIETRQEESINKVPLLGDLPFVGGVFRSRVTGSETNPEKQELVIFLTPHIISGEKPSTEVEEYRDLVRELERQYIEETRGIKKKPKRRPSRPEIRKVEKKVLAPVERPVVKKVEVEKPKPKPVTMEVLPKPAPTVPRKKKAKWHGKPLSELTPNEVYYYTVREKILENVRRFYPQTDIKGDVYISFSIMRDGSLKETPQILNPVEDVLKEAAIKSIQASAPFEPFPKTITKNQQTFKILIAYE